MKNNTAGWMEFGKICLKWGGGGVRGKQFKKQLLNITALMTDLNVIFHVHTCSVKCRNESYSEPHCTISENLAAKVLKQLEKRDVTCLFLFFRCRKSCLDVLVTISIAVPCFTLVQLVSYRLSYVRKSLIEHVPDCAISSPPVFTFLG